MISTYLSNKLRAISFISMCMVVFLHSYNLTINMNMDSHIIAQGYNASIQYFFSYGITRIAVPVFFMISGYLFFLKVNNFTFKTYVSKLIKRSRTLLTPYIFWSIFGILIYYILQCIPASKPFFTKTLIVNYSIRDYFSTIFIDPLLYQLWFIKDLIILVLLTPIIYWLIKINKQITIAFFFITWMMEFDYLVFSNEALLFFTIGAMLGINKKGLHINYYKKWFAILLPLWLLLLVVKTYLFTTDFQNEFVITYLHKFCIMIGIVVIWVFYDIMYRQKDISKKSIFKLFQFTFIIYAFHEPFLTILKKLFYFLIGKTELSSLLIYIFAPIIAILGAIFTGHILKKFSPVFYKVVTGNR